MMRWLCRYDDAKAIVLLGGLWFMVILFLQEEYEGLLNSAPCDGDKLQQGVH